MANVRTCLLFLVLLVNYRLVTCQPTFGTQLWCSMVCPEYDSSSDESDDYSFFDIFDWCYGCYSTSSSAEVTTTTKPIQQPVKLMIPPSTGLNLTVFSNIGGVLMDLVPWISSPTTAAPAAQVTTTAAPAPAGNGTEGNATAPSP